MKSLITNTLFTSLVILLLLITQVYRVNAQENQGFSITPAIIEINPGKEYVLKIDNLDVNSQVFQLSPVLLEADQATRQVKVVDSLDTDINNYIKLEKDIVEIPPNSSATVKVNYLSELKNFMLGVSVSSVSNISDTVGVNYRLISVIVDYSVNESTAISFLKDLEIKPRIKVSRVSFSNKYNVITEIKNESTKVQKIFGELQVREGSTRLDTINYNSFLPEYVYPEESVNIKTQFEDNRSLFSRLGKTTFVSMAIIDGKEIYLSESILVIPWQVLLIIFLPLIITITGALLRTNLIRSKIQIKRKR